MIPLLFAMAAHAGGSYIVDAPIVGPVPQAATTRDAVHWYNAWPVASGVQDFEVSSSWPYVTCGVSDGSVYARFLATENNWPSSFPATVTCNHAGYSLTLNLVPRESDWIAPAVSVATSGGVSLSYPPSDGDPTGGFQVYFLPHSGFTYGLWAAQRDGADWANVSCAVAHADGQAFLRIWIWPQAHAGSGACVLPLAAGGTMTIPLTLSR